MKFGMFTFKIQTIRVTIIIITTHGECIFEAAFPDVPVDSISPLTEARVDHQAEIPTATEVIWINKLFKIGIMAPPVTSLQEY